MTEPHILVTNDDGVDAAGLLALAEAMRAFGAVDVVAPATNQSACGHKKTLFQDIAVREVRLANGMDALAVGGSPADCISLAAMGLRPFPPRLIVSGINRGENMAQDLTYSGTVTAALEGALQAVPAVAFSLAARDAENVADYAIAARVAQVVVRYVLARRLPPLTILNVNIPAGTPKGIRVTRQGVRIYLDALVRNGETVRIEGEPPTGILDEVGTDLWAIAQGYVSVTPIHLDMTAHRFIADVAGWDLVL